MVVCSGSRQSVSGSDSRRRQLAVTAVSDDSCSSISVNVLLYTRQQVKLHFSLSFYLSIYLSIYLSRIYRFQISSIVKLLCFYTQLYLMSNPALVASFENYLTKTKNVTWIFLLI